MEAINNLAKEYGKLTTEQFQTLVNDLPEVRGQMKELPELVRNTPKERLKEILDGDFEWSAVYELPYENVIALLIMSLGQSKAIHAIVNSADPQQALIEWGKTDPVENWNGGDGGNFTKSHMIGLLAANQRNILSIMLYHRTICDLVKSVRENGDQADEDFFKAVKVDRSVITCPTFSKRIAKAELIQDKDFFRHLNKSLKGIPSKQWEAYNDLRYGFALLRDCGFSKLSDAQLEDLFVNKLGLYPKHHSARKNLRKQIALSNKIATTSK
jgi:hypothetical protein